MVAERVVYIIDDDPATRRSLERLLDAADFRVASYSTAKAFLNVAPNLSAGCALLDLRMPEIGGLEAQAQLFRIRPDLPVIMMTGQGDVQSAVRAMKGGAVDFVEKPYGDDALIATIESALRRDESRGKAESDAAVALIKTLSTRERQVLNALVTGQPNKTIAFDLGISVRTVEVHRARMMDRLGVHKFAEAVRLAVVAKLASES
jgi:two-component system, LuxR family, response regulator FixJ